LNTFIGLAVATSITVNVFSGLSSKYSGLAYRIDIFRSIRALPGAFGLSGRDLLLILNSAKGIDRCHTANELIEPL
jgi:hypothetical protein